MADAAGLEPHQHLARPRLRQLHLLHDERLPELLQHGRAHSHAGNASRTAEDTVVEGASRGPWWDAGALLAQVAASRRRTTRTAKLGLDLAFETTSVTAIWPPTGIALAALVLGGPRLWPGVALGAFLANMDTGVPPTPCSGSPSATRSRRSPGAWLLEPRALRARARDGPRRARAGRPRRDRRAPWSAPRSASRACSPATSSTSATSPSVWRTWWLGDMGGDLIVAPALLVAATTLAPHRPAARLARRGRRARWRALAGDEHVRVHQGHVAHLPAFPAADLGGAALLAAGRGRGEPDRRRPPPRTSRGRRGAVRG